jgi:hypothetical protein
MTTLYWITVGIAGAVAYVGMAGVVFRRISHGTKFEPLVIPFVVLLVPVVLPMAVVDALAKERPDDWEVSASILTALWPLTVAGYAAGTVVWRTARAFALPFRATFRLCAGTLRDRQG